MNEFMPRFAPLAALSFLGAVFLLGVSALVLLYGAARRSRFLAKWGAAAFFLFLASYGALLCGASLFSKESVLPPGGWKYFCEIDCHIAYSVVDSRITAGLGPETQQVTARGKFVVVRVKTWFDERTISARRGNGPLTPNPRFVFLVDEAGRTFPVSPAGSAAIARENAFGAPLAQPLRPGESYTTTLVFDAPMDSKGLRLLITDAGWSSRLIIGQENSPLHAKVYLGLEPGPAPRAATTPNSH